MFLSWWMLTILGLFWFVSITVHGRISFETGATAVITKLDDAGYIKLNDDGNIIGLCNRDQNAERDK